MLVERPTNVVGRRVGAFLIDLLVTSVVNAAIFFALAEKRDEAPDSGVFAQVTVNDDVWAVSGGNAALYYALLLAFGLVWWVLLPGLKGWTPGKRLVGIRVVDAEGRCPAGIGRNLVRQLMWVADGFPYLIPYLTGFVTALTTKGNRRVGDMVAGTYVVRADAVGRSPVEPVPTGAPMPAPAFAQPPASEDAPSAPPASGGGASAPAASAPPGWHPDPQGEKRLRWWDGSRWTDQTAD